MKKGKVLLPAHFAEVEVIASPRTLVTTMEAFRPDVDLVTREQAVKILGFSLMETVRRVHGLTKFITKYTIKKLLYFWDDFS